MMPSCFIPREKGYTIIELVIIILVISILTTLSFTTYTHFLKKARTVEVQKVLSDLAKQQQAYFVAHDEYTTDINALGLPILGNQKLYTITIAVPNPNTSDPNSFLATARANIDSDPAFDEWTIDEARFLDHKIMD